MTQQAVVSVSIPRSGHHLLVQLLQAYFGHDKFSYCEFYTPPDCCGQVPCIRPNRMLQKNHDHSLQLAQRDDVRYLIEYRNFIESAVSDYELFISAKSIEGTEQLWMMFCIARLDYWKAFVNKWILETPPRQHLTIAYDALLANTKTVIQDVIDFIRPGPRIEEERVQAALGKVNILANRDVREFKYYRSGFFTYVEEGLRSYYEQLAIRPVLPCDPEQRDAITSLLRAHQYGAFARLVFDAPAGPEAISPVSLDSRISSELIEQGFMFLLARRPESQNVIRSHFDLRTVGKLREVLIGSDEFRLKRKHFGDEDGSQRQPLNPRLVAAGFLLILGRVPTADVLESHVRSDKTVGELRRNLLMSREFGKHIGATA